MAETARNPELAAFDRLVGEWTLEATHPMFPSTVVNGHATYEWLEGERFLIQRSSNDHPDFPDSISVIGFADEELTAHYFDSRGVFRIYRVAMQGNTLRMWRDEPGSSQRLEAKLGGDGATLTGVWQLSPTTRRGPTTSRSPSPARQAPGGNEQRYRRARPRGSGSRRSTATTST